MGAPALPCYDSISNDLLPAPVVAYFLLPSLVRDRIGGFETLYDDGSERFLVGFEHAGGSLVWVSVKSDGRRVYVLHVFTRTVP